MFQPTLCGVIFYTTFLTAVALPWGLDEGSGSGDELVPEDIVELVPGDIVELEQEEDPVVMVGILARNTAHTLLNFLGYLENLDYPKHRMSIWIQTDHNEDETLSMLSEWTDQVSPLYSSVHLGHEEEWLYASREPLLMTEERCTRISQLRQEGLVEARKSAQYLFWLNCDVFLLNNQTLRLLVEQQKPVISPMLESDGITVYSNFWCGQDERGYYKRTPEYLPIRNRDKVGSFKVPVVNSAVLIDVQTPKSEGLTYWPLTTGFNGAMDDMIHFAYSAKTEGIDMYVLNTEPLFGYTLKPEKYEDMAAVSRQFEYFRLHTLVNHPPVLRTQHIASNTPKDKAGLDEIFMINLERRPERKNYMFACFDELHLNVTWFKAVDGRELNQTYLDKLGVTFMTGMRDSLGERNVTFGEAGCFLSHYFIWKEVLQQNFEVVMVLEDDVNFFQPDFRKNLQVVLDDAHRHTPSWDLIYLGRNRQNRKRTLELIPGTKKLVIPHYSYWTIGYLLSIRGAQKLVEARPLDNLLPADEYFNILSGIHPKKDWAAHFPGQKLETYSAHPLLVKPTHFVGDAGWFSDTEPEIPIEARFSNTEIPERVLKEANTRRKQQEKEEESRQKEIRDQATKRQIEAMKTKLRPKVEL